MPSNIFTIVQCYPSSLTHTYSLQERKEQWRKEEEERKRNIPDPSIPAGHTLMSEKDRQDTLQSLKESMHLILITSALK